MKTVMRILLGLMLSLWSGVYLAAAQSGYPEPLTTYVNDYAHVLSLTEAANIVELLTNLKSQAGIQATVVTINSIQDYPTGDKTIEAFATHLFNTWGIGDKAANKGVLILVAVQDRKVRIELGTGYENQYNDDMQEVINDFMLPAFKQGNYSRGLYQGSRAVIAELTGTWPPDKSPAQSTTSGSNVSAPLPATSTSKQSGGDGGVACIAGIIIVLMAYSFLARIFGWPLADGRIGQSHRRSSWSSSSSSSRRSSSSSSRSSFGGGRSSGGGGSGSW